MSRRSSDVLAAFAAAALLAVAAAPGLSAVLVEVCALTLLGLSLHLVLRPLGAASLFQPGVFASAAWLTAELLRRNQSPVIALAVAALVGAVLGLVCLSGHRGGLAGLSLAGLGTAVVLTALVPPAPAFLPPVFLGVSLGTPRAAVLVALLALALGVWLHDTLLEGDLSRWLAISRESPGLLPRAGVSLPAVRGAALGLAGALAGLAGWAVALGTLGTPAARGVDPGVVFAWLLVPLAAGPGLTGILAGAAVFTGLARLAAAAGLPALALAGPLAAVLIWRETSTRARAGMPR